MARLQRLVRIANGTWPHWGGYQSPMAERWSEDGKDGVVVVRRRGWQRILAIALLSLLLLALVLISMLLVMRQPSSLVSSVDLGGPFVPFSGGGSIWWSQLGLLTVVLGIAFVVWLLVAPRPLVDLRDWWRSVREADLVGAALLSVALGGIILAFATADPEVQVFSPAGLWYLSLAAVAAVLFWLHNRRSTAPLVPHEAFAERPAWGAVLVSFFVGRP